MTTPRVVAPVALNEDVMAVCDVRNIAIRRQCAGKGCGWLLDKKKCEAMKHNMKGIGRGSGNITVMPEPITYSTEKL